MINVCALDLASVHSAHVVLGAEAEFVRQESTWTYLYSLNPRADPRDYLAKAVTDAAECYALLVCEDIPPIHRFGSIEKLVCRLQGSLIEKAHLANVPLVFVMPSLWQRAMGVWRKPPTASEALAVELGYTPPDIMTRFIAEDRIPVSGGEERRQMRDLAKKIRTDYVSAFLIGVWAQREIEQKGLSASFTQSLTSIG